MPAPRRRPRSPYAEARLDESWFRRRVRARPEASLTAEGLSLTTLESVGVLEARLTDILQTELDDIHGLRANTRHSILTTVGEIFAAFHFWVQHGQGSEFFEAEVRARANDLRIERRGR